MRPRGAAALAALLLAAGATKAAAGADVRAGERLFRAGVNVHGEPVRALVGLPPAPLVGERAACGACHTLGPSAGAGDAAPDLRWDALVRSGAGPGGRPYDERAFARAVNEGLQPSGAPIGHAMPRYSLSRRDLGALAAFLKSQPAAKNP